MTFYRFEAALSNGISLSFHWLDSPFSGIYGGVGNTAAAGGSLPAGQRALLAKISQAG